jgi:alkanesulfonate monooxygenase SsuD/methylene tetrahydromethanopterin reductase-like flavin-dependent oxidoreductase (luciferase family)
VTRIGVTLPQFTDDPDRFVGAALRAESLGLDSVWVFDHQWPLTGGKQRPALEAWSALAWLAAATERVTIGTLVTRSTMRHPALLAKMAATVAGVAPGRVVVALGSGDEASRDENDAAGLPYFGGDARLAQLESCAVVLTDALTAGEVSRRDEFVKVSGLPVSPLPAPRPPVWLAGRSRGAIALAGRLADGWNGWGGSPERFALDVARLRRAAGGRTVEPTWAGLALLDGSDAEARARAAGRDASAFVVGGPDTLARHLAAMSSAGAEQLIVTFPDAGRTGAYERLAAEVRPRLEAATVPGGR